MIVIREFKIMPICLLLCYSQEVSTLIIVRKFRIVLISVFLFYPVVLSFIASKCSDCYWRIKNDADVPLSLLHYYSLIYRMYVVCLSSGDSELY